MLVLLAVINFKVFKIKAVLQDKHNNFWG